MRNIWVYCTQKETLQSYIINVLTNPILSNYQCTSFKFHMINFSFFVINLSTPIWQIQCDATTFWSLVTINMIVSHKLLSWMCLHPFDAHKAYHIFSIFDDNRDMIILVNTTNVRKDQKTQMPNLLIVVKIAKCVTNNQNTAMTGCR